MEYIIRSPEPAHLSNNKRNWVKPWVDHYRKTKDESGKLIRPVKPSDSHWTHNLIRQVLILDFKNNCGYCGHSRPMPQTAENKQRVQRGHVDHFRAKAFYPELTYEWSNYIWSCESCNTEKGEFEDQNDPIFNPCDESDCSQLLFINDTGKYCLYDQDGPSVKRFLNTERSTMLNAAQVAKTRGNKIKTLESLFKGILVLLKYPSDEVAEELINEYILNIKNELEDESFYFLTQKNYSMLRDKYPSVTELIDS